MIDNGFYYDFAYKRPFSTEDLAAIETRMAEISAKDLPVHRRVMPRDAAIEHFKKIGEHYKAEIISAIPQGEKISLYGHGGLGGPMPRSSCSQHREAQGVQAHEGGGRSLLRGDSRNEMLQRIYGTAWANEKAAQGVSDPIGRGGGKARSSAHRQGTRSASFPGGSARRGLLASGKGWALFQQLIAYMRQRQTEAGYQEVNTFHR